MIDLVPAMVALVATGVVHCFNTPVLILLEAGILDLLDCGVTGQEGVDQLTEYLSSDCDLVSANTVST